MSTLKHRTLTLVAVLAVAAAGCGGKDGAAGAAGQNGAPGTPGAAGGAGSNGNNGAPGAPGTSAPPGLANSGLVVNVTGATVDATNQVTVTFTMADNSGLPVDFKGAFSVNTVIQPRFALARIDTATDGSVLPYAVLTQESRNGGPLQPTAFSPVTATGAAAASSTGVLAAGASFGTYTYTFPVSAAIDPAKAGQTHTIWIQASRQTDLDDPTNVKTFVAVNKEFNFAPNGGALPVARRQVVATDGCSKCHSSFKPEGITSNEFHSGGRMEAPFCNVCHNPGHVSNPIANAPVFVHRIHAAKQLQAASIFDNIAETAYPQDLRNCKQCHGGALQGDQYLSKPTRESCGSCHDYVDFTGTVAQVACTSPLTLDAAGKPVPCLHLGGTQANDTACAGCHYQAPGTTNPFFIGEKHIPIADPNPANVLVPQTSGTATAGVKVTKTCIPGAPCNDCQATYTTTGSGALFPVITSTTNCISIGYTFIGSTGGNPTTINDTAFFDATGKACGTGTIVAGGTKQQATPCTCTDAAPCFANPLAKLGATLTPGVTVVTNGFGGGTACGDGKVTATGTNPASCACTPENPCIGAGNNNTNAASIAAAGATPVVPNGTPAPIQVVYDLKSVSRNANKNPVMVFRLMQSVNGGAPTRVDLNTFDTAAPTDGQELWPNFVGSPSLYWVYSVPQDNITEPADYNGSTSVYLRSLWNHTATTSSAGTLAFDAATGYYTATLTGSVIPDNARMLTGGIGYTYGLTTTPPLVQTNVFGFPYGDVAPVGTALAGSARQGGLLMPAADVKLVASTGKTTGTQTVGKQGTTNCTANAPCTCTPAAPCSYPPRRQIIDNKKCQTCHVALGANPTFHAGQRNDGESCSWCHNPNQNNSGWSGNAKDMIHALHAGTAAGVVLPNGSLSPGTGKRSYPYTWDAESIDEGFWEVTFPGPRNNCEACHATQYSDAAKTIVDPTKHTYDFSASDSAAAVPNLLWSTEATNAVTLQNFVNSVFGSSPYITTQDYGKNVSVDKATGVLTQGADTNLMTSPITAACIACHDSPTQKSHIIAMNGQFYVQRSLAKGLATLSPTDPNQESCLICHGPQPNSIAPIADMHNSSLFR